MAEYRARSRGLALEECTLILTTTQTQQTRRRTLTKPRRRKQQRCRQHEPRAHEPIPMHLYPNAVATSATEAAETEQQKHTCSTAYRPAMTIMPVHTIDVSSAACAARSRRLRTQRRQGDVATDTQCAQTHPTDIDYDESVYWLRKTSSRCGQEQSNESTARAHNTPRNAPLFGVGMNVCIHSNCCARARVCVCAYMPSALPLALSSEANAAPASSGQSGQSSFSPRASHTAFICVTIACEMGTFKIT